MIKIIIYQTKIGKEPFTQWLHGLERITRFIVDTRIERMTLGNYGDCKGLKGASGIFELRIDYGPGYRIYFGKEGQSVVILLVGGDKKNQDNDIAKAKKYWLDFKDSK